MPGLSELRKLDAQDPLKGFRERFVIDESKLIYLDGNSLGRMPKSVRDLATEMMDHQWAKRLIRSWNESWWQKPQEIAAKIAKLIGAEADEVLLGDSTSINLFKLAAAALVKQQGRPEILSDDMNFPSDIYVFQGLIKLLDKGHQLTIMPSDGIYGPAEALMKHISDNTALLSLSHTVFKSGYRYDMATINEAAHQKGALVLWDLSHSVGSVPVKLNETGADLAIGCSYKYLNGGPGAPAFLYVRRDLQAQLKNPLSGWWGEANPFDFGLSYRPAEGIRRFQVGTQPMLSLAMVEAGVDLLLEAGMDRVREKSLSQGQILIDLWRERLAPLGFKLNSPQEGHWRGSHISLGHDKALGIDLAMIHDKAIIPDFRPPDNIRLGITPLYTSFEELYLAVDRMVEIMEQKLYQPYLQITPTVT
ncbi:MAG: kynureninase [Deinococcales bacterium]